MIPLGKAEDHELEFKSREALRSLTPIGRAVVGMLNSDGGKIWIGVREEAGRAVSIEDIPDATLQQGRVWDHLLDSIEPRPDPAEVKIEAQEHGSQNVLCITVKTGKRRPYAYLREGGIYLVRAGARTRPMSREELREHFARGQEEAPSALERVRRIRATLPSTTRGPSFWILLLPEQELELDLGSGDLRRLLSDPEASGNRASGWTVMNRFAKTGTRAGFLFSKNEESEIRIHRDGSITYEASLGRLWHGEAPRQIYPYALCELTVSLLRLGAVVYQKSQQAGGHMLADMALPASGGWFIRSRSPSAYGYMIESHRHEYTLPEEGFFLSRPMRFSIAEELVPNPDWCAFRLIQRTYEEFGFPEEEVPAEFDRASRRFVLGRKI